MARYTFTWDGGKSASGGRGYSREASSAPLVYFFLQLPSRLWLFQATSSFYLGSSDLATTLRPSLPIFQPGGNLPPGASYIPSRAACTSLQLHPAACNSAQPKVPCQSTLGSLLATATVSFKRASQGVLLVTCACPFPASGFMRSPLPVGHLSSV